MRTTWLALLAVIIAAAWWQLKPTTPQTVQLHRVKAGLVERISANSRAGTVFACKSSDLSLAVGGRVAKLYVDEGEAVKAEQLLLELDNSAEEARLALASADLLAAQIEQQRSCDAAALARREADRAESLLNQKLVSSERLDQLKTDAKLKGLSCSQSEAMRQHAEAAEQLAQIQLNNTRLYAPFNGTIAAVNGEIGEIATPSPPGIQTPPAIELIDDSCLYIEAPIDEVEASRVEVGQPTRVTLDAFRGQIFNGAVSRTGTRVSALEKQARTLDIEVILVNPPEEVKLLVGYSADVEIVTGHADPVVRVPTEALLGGNQIVRFNSQSSRLEKVAVEVGLSNWSWSEIRSGIQAGDQILVRLEKLDELLDTEVNPQ